MEQLTNILKTGILRFFNSLRMLGKSKPSDTRNLLIVDAIEYIYSKLGYYIEDKDVAKLNKTLNCASRSCYIDKRLTPTDNSLLHPIKKIISVRKSEFGNTRITEDNRLRFATDLKSIESPTITKGLWALEFNVTSKEIAAKGQTIAYNAKVTRTDTLTYKDGTIKTVVKTETAVVTSDTSGITVNKNQIIIPANPMNDNRTITLYATGEGRRNTIELTQIGSANIEIINVKESNPEGTNYIVFNKDYGEIDCHDCDFVIYLKKIGSVSNIEIESISIGDWFIADYDDMDNIILVSIISNNDTNDVRHGSITIKYNNAQETSLTLTQSYITEKKYKDPIITNFYYNKISENGGSVSPTIEATQIYTEIRSNGSFWDDNADLDSASKTFSDTTGTIAENGKFTYSSANLTTEEITLATVTLVYSNGGKLATKQTDIKQKARTLKCMVGVLKTSISNMTYGSAKISNITSEMLSTAISQGFISETNIHTSSDPITINADFEDFYIGLIPTDASFNSYKWKVDNGLGGYDEFESTTDKYCNGEIIIELSGINYKMYGMIATSNSDSVNLINK